MENQTPKRTFFHKGDVMRKEFFFGVAAMVVAISMLSLYHPATFAVQLIQWYFVGVLSVASIFWIGRKLMKVIGVVLFVVTIGMIVAIMLGNTPAIG
jgi:hypothetical protein